MKIYDVTDFPTAEEWDSICNKKIDSIDRIQLRAEKTKYNGFDFSGINHSYWLREFNNRCFDLINNYVLLMHYYSKGIPDKEWYISPGKEGQSVQYFPHFEDKHYLHLYWFGFYMESYYTRFSSVMDTIYHLLNTRFNLEVPHTVSFRGNVTKKINEFDDDLHHFLINIPNNTIYKKITDFRNNIVHNYRANQVDPGCNKKVKSDGTKVYTMSVGNYTTSSEFVQNIEDSLDFLADVVDEIRGKVEQKI